jgi:hypothetical protein
VAKGGFTRFLRLSRPAALDELDEATPTPTRQFADATTQGEAAPTCLASVDGMVVVGEKKTPVEVAPDPLRVARRSPSYVWRSQANRNSIFDMEF